MPEKAPSYVPRQVDSSPATSTAHTLKKYHSFHHDHPAADWRTFSHWATWDRRNAVFEAMQIANVSAARITRFQQCRSRAWVSRHPHSGQLRLQTNSCGSRWCPACARSLSQRLQARLFNRIPPATYKYRFLTLTQPQREEEPFSESYLRILRSFTKLRRTPWWKATVRAGVYCVETTPSKTYERTYHVHIHVIVDSTWVDPATFQRSWCKACDADVAVCDARLARSLKSVSRYIGAYLTKGIPEQLYDDPVGLATIVGALDNKPFARLLGAWSRDPKQRAIFRLYPKPDASDFKTWEYVGEIDTLIEKAEAGDPSAATIIRDLGYPAVQLVIKFPAQPAQAKQRAPPRQARLPLKGELTQWQINQMTACSRA